MISIKFTARKASADIVQWLENDINTGSCLSFLEHPWVRYIYMTQLAEILPHE